jgi:hypothetical protein
MTDAINNYAREQLSRIQDEIVALSKKTMWELIATSGHNRNDVFTETFSFNQHPFTIPGGRKWVPDALREMTRKYGETHVCFISSMMVRPTNYKTNETHTFIFTPNFYIRYRSYTSILETHYECLEWKEVTIPRNLLVFYKMFTPGDKPVVGSGGGEFFRHQNFIEMFESNPMAFANVLVNEDEQRERQSQIEHMETEQRQSQERIHELESELKLAKRENRLLESEKSQLESTIETKDALNDSQAERIRELTNTVDTIRSDMEKKHAEKVNELTTYNLELQKQVAELKKELARTADHERSGQSKRYRGDYDEQRNSRYMESEYDTPRFSRRY